MFVHWGLYAIPGWHEQHQWRGQVARDEYGKLKDQWDPVNFDPDAWLDLAESVGMQYLVVTTKHHDGFCLFETKETAFNTVDSPYEWRSWPTPALVAILPLVSTIHAPTGTTRTIRIRDGITNWKRSLATIRIWRSISSS